MNDQLLSVIVQNKYSAAEDILCLELKHIEGLDLPLFDAGAHVDLHIADFIRQYSICSSPTDQKTYRLAIKLEQEGRGGSRAVHSQIKQGDQLTISTPRNNFPLQQTANHSILIAGGIGITPMLSMAQHCFDQKQSFELHYCCRSKEHAVFYAELTSGDLQNSIHFHFDDGGSDQKLDLINLLNDPQKDAHLYVCGPVGFMDYVTTTASDQFSWPTGNVHIESFSAVDLSEEGDNAFFVEIASTGKAYTIPADKNVVEVLEEHGVDIPISCEQGICGTCLTGVLEGVPDHRDMFMTDPEHAKNDQFTPCCSRSISKVLVLDL